jgi:hypothetical protein
MKYKIFCINLINRKDRLENMKKIFDQLKISEKVDFNIVKKNEKSSINGCYSSHYNCLMNFHKDKDLDYIIIFEDDCKIKDNNIKWDNIIKDIELYLYKKNYGYFSIGCIPIGIKINTIGDNIIKTLFSTTLCYAIKREEFLKLEYNLKKYLDTNTHIDIFYINFINNQIGYKNPIFYQIFTDSDNQWISKNNNFYEKLSRNIFDLSQNLNINDNLIYKIFHLSGVNTHIKNNFKDKIKL